MIQSGAMSRTSTMTLPPSAAEKRRTRLSTSDFQDGVTTSQVLGNRSKTTEYACVGLGIALALSASLHGIWFLPTIPIFVLLTLESSYLGTKNGLILGVMWLPYMLLAVVTPVVALSWALTLGFFSLPWAYASLLVYLPMFLTAYCQKKQTAGALLKFLIRISWDVPLILVARVVHAFGGRFLQPFANVIDDDLVVGSIPLDGDAKLLAGPEFEVGAIVNMMDECEGNVEEYRKLGIPQHYAPTVDLTCPTISTLEGCVDFIRRFKASTAGRNKRVYVHCKGGRGRAATVALAYLITERNMPALDAALLLKSKRPMIAPKVLLYKKLQEFCALKGKPYTVPSFVKK